MMGLQHLGSGIFFTCLLQEAVKALEQESPCACSGMFVEEMKEALLSGLFGAGNSTEWDSDIA